MPEFKSIGFIGLGVMGEPICRNLVKKSGSACDRVRSRRRAAGAAACRRRRDRGLGRRCRQAERLAVSMPAQRETCARGVRRRWHSEQYPRRPGRCRSRHLVGQPDPRFCPAVAGEGRVMGRCADRAHAAGGAGRHAQRHGRRDAGALRRNRAVDPLLCHRRHPLRRRRRGAGDQDPQQHGAVRNRQRARRGGRGRESATASIRRCCSIRCRRDRPTVLRCAITA